MKDASVDALLSALANSSRRRMLDLLMAHPGMSVKALASHFDTSRVAVLKHVDVLEEVELVVSKKEGRTRHLFFNAVPIQLLHDRWTSHYGAFWSQRMVDVKSRLEGRAARRKGSKGA